MKSLHRTKNQQHGFWQVVRDLPVGFRFIVGLIASACLSFCTPIFISNLLTLGQSGIRDLNNTSIVAAIVLFLMAINLVGNKLRIMWHLGAAFSGLMLSMNLYGLSTGMSPFSWSSYTSVIAGATLILAAGMPLLNAFLLVQYKHRANLK